MIQPEKLRKGNYIRTEPRSENNYYKVLKVDDVIGSVSVQHHMPIATGNKEHININCCFPIDITTEILNSSGFREKSPYKYFKDDLYLQIKRYGEVSVHFESKDIVIHVSGVNELQNAYHSITGKELEIVFD